MTVVRLAGVDLPAYEDISWTHKPGVNPTTKVIQVDPGGAAAIRAAAKDGPITLELGSIRINGLFYLRDTDSTEAYLEALIIADVRCWLPYASISRRYNMPRRSGKRRRLQESAPLETRPIADDIDFEQGSLNNNKEWLARAMMLDALQRVVRQLPYDIKATVALPARYDDLLVQSLPLRGDGDDVLLQALSRLPGAKMYADGLNLVVADRFDRYDEEVFAQLDTHVSGTNAAAFVSFNNVRPQDIEVMFQPEYELRLDSKEGADTSSRSTELRGTLSAPSLSLINVLPCPVPTLTLVGGETVVEGQWITFDDLFDALPSNYPAPEGFGELTHELVQEVWNIPAALNVYAFGSGEPDPQRIAIINTVWQHYRQTYRINRKLMDMLLSVRPYRVAILDVETGTRAPAAVYADYALAPYMRTIFAEEDDAAKQNFIWNVSGYADSLASAKQAPVILSVLDPDQGILRVDYQIDKTGQFAKIYPSQMQNIASADPTEAATLFEDSTKMAGSHKLAIVLTAAPAYPNDERALYSVIVKPEDVGQVLGRKIDNARGPRMRYIVAPNIDTARFAWQDDRASAYDLVFDPKTDGPKASLEAPTNQEGLVAIAKGIAATIWARYIDKPEGAHTIGLTDGFQPRGFLDSIEHTVTPDGAGYTTLVFAENLAPVDFTMFLPQSVRDLVTRAVQR